MKTLSTLFVFAICALATTGSAERETSPDAPEARMSIELPGIAVPQGNANATAASDADYAGLSLRQREFARAERRRMRSDLDTLQRHCGFVPTMSVDWSSFASLIDQRLDGEMNRGFYSRCLAPLNWLRRQCQNDNDDAVAAFRQRFATYRCVSGGEGGRSMSTNGSQLVYAMDIMSVNDDAFLNEWFGRSL